LRAEFEKRGREGAEKKRSKRRERSRRRREETSCS
jgi:hypothetical protein